MKTYSFLMILLLQVLAIFIAFTGAVSQAQSVHVDFNRRDEKTPSLSPQEVRERFEVGGETIFTDGEGNLKFMGGDVRFWKFAPKGSLSVNTSIDTPDSKPINLRHEWKFDDKGRITVQIKQYESMTMNPKGGPPSYGKLIREETIQVKDFAPVSWVAFADTDQRVIVRLTPRLNDTEKPVTVDSLPISLMNPVIFDGKGRLWARGDGRMEGKYIAIKGHMGEIALSYVPFKGAKEIGLVRDGEITIDAGDGLKIFARSGAPILAGGRPTKVFGWVDTKKKSTGPNSVHVQSGDQEAEFLRGL